ncbi:MAG: hypothetical protein U0744_00370 [Gemmataceae bacterium]
MIRFASNTIHAPASAFPCCSCRRTSLPSDCRIGKRLLTSLKLPNARPTRQLGNSSIDDYRSQATSLLTSPDAAIVRFIPRIASDALHHYGLTRFGQSCLLIKSGWSSMACRSSK